MDTILIKNFLLRQCPIDVDCYDLIVNLMVKFFIPPSLDIVIKNINQDTLTYNDLVYQIRHCFTNVTWNILHGYYIDSNNNIEFEYICQFKYIWIKPLFIKPLKIIPLYYCKNQFTIIKENTIFVIY
jgi:hypothetical protein